MQDRVGAASEYFTAPSPGAQAQTPTHCWRSEPPHQPNRPLPEESPFAAPCRARKPIATRPLSAENSRPPRP